MSAASGAFGAKAGFNQSGGGYYIVTGSGLPALANFVIAGQQGSGGASVPPQLSTGTTANANIMVGLNAASSLSSMLASGQVIRDMGKTIVSSTRVFRKFQATYPRSLSTGGVGGPVSGAITGSTADTGYFDFYLEVTQGGSPGTAPPIARTYF